ncbi:methyltransferase dimerization domain-containing protein [Streptomyces indonesiensis]
MTQAEVPIEVELRGLYKAHYRFQFLSAAFQLGLFALVEKEPGLAVGEIATRLGLKEQPTRILLLGCTVFGLLDKKGDSYYITPLEAADRQLRRGARLQHSLGTRRYLPGNGLVL